VAQVPAQPPEQRWLVEHLWLASGVGILGGAPKVCKTYLAAELSLAVASGTKALGRFPVKRQGPVLFYGAEDSLASLRERFGGLAQARQLELARLPIYLLDVPVLRLDRDEDLVRLRASIAELNPLLLVLDPFVRMAHIDENSAADVSAVLGSLREIQRAHDLAVLLVHHARKSPAQNVAQALRGSSDFAAWSDTNLYLSRRSNRLTLSLEHRSAPAPEPFDLRLAADPQPHLRLLQDETVQDTLPATIDPLQAEILGHLNAAQRPVSTVELRRCLCKRKEDVVRALADLREIDQVARTPNGWIAKPFEQLTV
jgi:hypothetical protein